MKKILLFITLSLLFISRPAIASPGDVFESQTAILYSGTGGQTDSFQPLGTTYTQLAGGAGVYITSGSASSVIELQECSSSAYADCVSVASTTTFSVTTIDGNQESSSTFLSAYQMTSSKYYRLRWTSGGHRIQCGNTSAMTPIVGSDATPAGACAAAGRAWTFNLYEGAGAALTRKIRFTGISR